MNNDIEKSPRHFLKIPDGKLTIHFIWPYDTIEDEQNKTSHRLFSKQFWQDD